MQSVVKTSGFMRQSFYIERYAQHQLKHLPSEQHSPNKKNSAVRIVMAVNVADARLLVPVSFDQSANYRHVANQFSAKK